MASPADLKTRLQQLGLDATWHQVDQATEDARRTRQSPSLGIRVKEQRIAAETEKRQAAHEKALDEGRIDARTADPAAVQARLEQLGVDYDLRTSIREKPKPLPPKEDFNPMAASLEAQRRAQRRAKQALKSGTPANAREMPPDVLTAYMKLRGWTPPAGW